MKAIKTLHTVKNQAELIASRSVRELLTIITGELAKYVTSARSETAENFGKRLGSFGGKLFVAMRADLHEGLLERAQGVLRASVREPIAACPMS